MVRVKWHGHACFELRTSSGTVVVFDPHDGKSIGLKAPNVKADIVIVSHNHFDHNAAELVARPGALVIKERAAEIRRGEISVKGFPTYHDESMGTKRGRNVVYKVRADDVDFVHLGDLGHVPSPELVEELRGVGVLFVPVGGTFTIGPREAVRVIELLEPKIAVPMHYKVTGLNLPLSGLEEFAALSKWPFARLGSSELEVNSNNLPEKTTVIALRPPI
ncbi:MAG: MBL fold metallo-hydrolase [Fervidicoccaceae archaeon]